MVCHANTLKLLVFETAAFHVQEKLRMCLLWRGSKCCLYNVLNGIRAWNLVFYVVLDGLWARPLFLIVIYSHVARSIINVLSVASGFETLHVMLLCMACAFETLYFTWVGCRPEVAEWHAAW